MAFTPAFWGPPTVRAGLGSDPCLHATTIKTKNRGAKDCHALPSGFSGRLHVYCCLE